jgi:hypothetical protein
MAEPMDPLTIVRRRLAAQRLVGAPCATPAEAVAWSGAMQAQEYAEALWSLGLRLRDHTAADVEAACDRGEILRTHVLRPTWHFVAAADLRWMLRLTGPRVQAKNAGRYRQLGLDGDTLRRCAEVIGGVLSDGEPRTRRELGAALVAAGIDTAGQRIAHIVLHVELEGLVASGPRRGRHHTYLLLDGRVPAAPQRSREDDVADLALRYFTSHGPATLRDFAWWSGLTVSDGRAALASLGARLVSAEGPDGSAWVSSGVAAGAPPGTGAFLLSTFDEALVAYRDLRNVHADGRATNDLLWRPVVIDGRTVGGWTRRLARREVTIEVVLDGPLDPGQHAALRAAADRFGAFVDLPARIVARVA